MKKNKDSVIYGKTKPDLLSVQEIKDFIRREKPELPLLIGREIHIFEEIDSTNIKGLDLGSQGSPEGTIILSETQSKGRGRLGREWISPKGNIYLSIILRPNISLSRSSLITLMAGVACASALRKAVDIPVSIKWPNDIIINEKKVGGILTEMSSEAGKINYIVLGIGINVNMDTSLLTPEVRAIAVSLREVIGRDVQRIKILSALLRELDKWYKVFLEKGSKPVLDEWKALSLGIGKRVRVVSLDRTIEGIAEGIDEDGRLLVRLDSGGLERIISGDVTVID